MSIQYKSLDHNALINKPARKRILLLCNYSSVVAETIYEHINAFAQYSENHIVTFNIFGEIDNAIPIEKFDILVIHYSICIGRGGFLSLNAKKIIREFKGYKILFIQDDYRWIYSTVSNIQYMGINAIFGLASQNIITKVYGKALLDSVRVETVLTGYISEKMLNEKAIPYSQRKIDVSYRARKLPFWMGRHTIQKWSIAEDFLKKSKLFQLKCDISTKEEDRLYGEDWKELLKQSKATLGTESGTNICDFTGKLQENVDAYLKKYPKATFEAVEKIFLGNEKNNIMMNVISPRIFEAISCRVLLILYPGEYNGILKPWRHYVPLNTDHSNIKKVISILQSPIEANRIIECAYNEILCNSKYHYQGLIQQFDNLIEEECKPYHHSHSEDCIIKCIPQPSALNLNNIKTYKLIYHCIKACSPKVILPQCFYYSKKLLRDILIKFNFLTPYHPNYSDFLKIKNIGYFDIYVTKKNESETTDTPIIKCALKSEKTATSLKLKHSEVEEIFKQQPLITMTVKYTELAEGFVDSFSELLKLNVVTLHIKQLKELIC